jgi:hypothetical protein
MIEGITESTVTQCANMHYCSTVIPSTGIIHSTCGVNQRSDPQRRVPHSRKEGDLCTVELVKAAEIDLNSEDTACIPKTSPATASEQHGQHGNS